MGLFQVLVFFLKSLFLFFLVLYIFSPVNFNLFKYSYIHITNELWKTLNWISKYYITPFGKVIKTAIPISFQKKITFSQAKYVKILSQGKKQLFQKNIHSKNQKIILQHLIECNNSIKLSNLRKIISNPYSVIKALEKKKYINVFSKNDKKIYDDHITLNKNKVVLTDEQQNVVNTITKSWGDFQSYLLHGIT